MTSSSTVQPRKVSAQSFVTALPFISAGTVRLRRARPAAFTVTEPSSSIVKYAASALLPLPAAVLAAGSGMAGRAISVAVVSPSIALMSRISCLVNTVRPAALR